MIRLTKFSASSTNCAPCLVTYLRFGRSMNSCTVRVVSPVGSCGTARRRTRLRRSALHEFHWTSKDLSRFGGGLNFYGYANDDPVNYVDVDGHNPIIAAIVVVIGMGLSAPSDTSSAPSDLVGMIASLPGPSVVGMLFEAVAERLPGFARLLVEVLADNSGAIRLGRGWKARDLAADLTNGIAPQCEKAARQIEKHLGGASARAQRVRITPKDPNARALGGYRNQSPNWAYHDAVVQDGRVFDAYTGAKGVPIEEYKALWEFPDAIDFGF